MILALALIPIAKQMGGGSITFISGNGGEPDSDGFDELTSMVIETGDNEIAKLEKIADVLNSDSVTFELAPPTLTTSGGTPSTFSLDSPILGGLKGRSGVLKDALLKAYGGTPGTEDAVASGLEWVVKQQQRDGSWSLVGPYKGGAAMENKPAATALAMLALVGAGNTHQNGPYKANVEKGLKYLIKIQDDDGYFASLAKGNQRTYAQAKCMIVIGELYGMTGDPKLEAIAMRGIKYAKHAQGKNGGWRYLPKDPGDTSVTGWYVMALISARMGGLLVDSEVLESVHEFLDSVQKSGRGMDRTPEGEKYSYMPSGVGTESMTAEGMLCRMYLGWSAQDPRIQAGCEFLCNNLISSSRDKHSFYYWYYGTTTLHHVGGDYWRRWNDQLKTELPALQEKSGPHRGSWAAQDDPHGAGGGRLYTTCFAILCLETYYRHLPLNRMSGE